jgi:O-antigen/teichoic acid export membrane protein
MQNRFQITVNGLWVAAGSALIPLCGLALNVLLTHLLSSSDMGRYFLIVSLTNTAAVLASLGLGQIAVREISKCLGVGNVTLAGQIVGGIFRCTLLSCGCMALMMLGLGRLMEAQLSLVLAMVAWMGTKTWQTLLTEVLRGFQDIRAATLYGNVLAYAIAAGFLTIAWLVYPRVELPTALLLLVGGWGLASVLAGWAVRQKLTMRLSSPVSGRQLVSQAWPILNNSLIWLVLTQADLWILTAFRPTSDVALYGVITRLAGLIAVPAEIAQKTISPNIAELYAQGRLAELESLLRTSATVESIPAVTVLIVYLFSAKLLLGIVYGPFYASGTTALIVLGIGQLINVGTGLCGTTLVMTGHQRSLLRLSIWSSLLTVALALLLARPLGVFGVAFAAGIGFTVQNLAMLLVVKRRIGIWTHIGLRRNLLRGHKI